MSVYLIATIKIHDRAKYAIYDAGFMEVFDKYRGKLLSVEEAPTPIEGDWDYTRTVIMEFPSEDEAKAWYHSAEYQALARDRFAASEGRIVMIRAGDNSEA